MDIHLATEGFKVKRFLLRGRHSSSITQQNSCFWGYSVEASRTKPVWKKNMNREEVAQLIERFLEGRSLYPQEWNAFVDASQDDDVIDNYRRECSELDPLLNRPATPDGDAIGCLREIVQRLRSRAST
ncbi:MAG TPA: hypothetical protein VKH81_14405 [Candidatus Angelobacter sp.]|nr:hypothetical protein [Candidatus Angelobacter sp.]